MKVILLFVLAGWLLLARSEGHSNNVFLRDVEHTHDDADHVEEKQAATQATTAPTTVKVEQPIKTTTTTTNDKVNAPAAASTTSTGNAKKGEEKQQTKTTTSETNDKASTPVAAGTAPKDNAKKVEEKQQTETSSPAGNVKVTAPVTGSTATKTEATVVKPKEPVAGATVKPVEAAKDGDGKKKNDIDAKDIPITQKVEDKKATVVIQKANPGTPVAEDVDDDDDDDEDEDDNDDDDDVEGPEEDVKKNATAETGSGQGSEKTKTESSDKNVEDKIEENLNDMSKGKDKFFIVWSDEGEWDSPDFQGDEGHIEDSMKNSKSFGAGDGVSKGDEVGDDEDNYESIDKAKGSVHDGKDIKGTESGGSGPGDKEKVAVAGTSTSGKSDKADKADVKMASEGGIEGAGKGPLHEDDEDDFDDEDDIEEVIKDEVNVKGEAKKSESVEKDEEGVCVKNGDENCGTDSDEDSWFKWLFDWLD